MTETRTSLTHPLQVATLCIGAAPGRIGISFCPGRQDASVAGAPWARDLLADVLALRAWGATAVLTLLESREFQQLGVPGLGQAVRDAGMVWHHAPIADFGTPDAAFMAAWQALAPALVGRVMRGEGVVLHCRGGLGRSGLVAALLATEAGASPAAALGAVRAVRPGAVETAAQEQFVLGFRRLTAQPG